MAIDPPHPRSVSPSSIDHLRQPSPVATIHACSCGWMVERQPDGTQRLWPSLQAHLTHITVPSPAASTAEIDRGRRRRDQWDAEMARRGGIYAGTGDEIDEEPVRVATRAPRRGEKAPDPASTDANAPETPHSAPSVQKPAASAPPKHRRSLRG